VPKSRGHTAIANEHGAGDVRGIIGREEGMNGRDLLRPGWTVERHV
jgi:hypothetical protein